MQKRWFIKQTPSSELTAAIQHDLKVSPLMATILAQRGLTTHASIRSFFNPPLTELHDPFLMLNLDRAVNRLEEAIQNQQHIVVYGDYDVDGTTAVALVFSILKNYTDVSYYIPDRYEEGYGLSFQGIDKALERGASLLIALDCGIKEVEKVAYANEKGLDIIVCDHHTPGTELPACIVLDPKQENCNYPYKELCGCGVGFKLLQGWLQKRGDSDEQLLQLLDLVAIAIGADIVPVTGENRVLAKNGLHVLNTTPRLGLEALLKHAGKELPLDLTAVVFTIAPRINAAGRLESGQRAVELLLANTPQKADAIAIEIDEYNQNRRLLDAQITEEALLLIEEDPEFEQRKSTVVFHQDWHKGVVGIVASRLIERHYRPTIVLTESKGVATGSARSVAGFNVYEAILQCEHLLTQFGGHHHAAGLTMPVENIAAFREAFDAVVQENITRAEEVEELVIDVEVKLHHLFLAGESVLQVPRLLKMQQEMEPFGPDNHKPVYCVHNVYAASSRVLKGAHLKLDLLDPSSDTIIPSIGFNMADKADLVASGCAFDAVFTLEANTWNGRTTLQLMLKDVREGE
ncbi:MAG: single-stranded-DNA-specific exonuclease RecJ [Fluviicola sp.]|nr:single-stranded-DNA-specific exonuclease RecJ [Fluviicola sp.]